MNNSSLISNYLKIYKKLFSDEIIIPQKVVLKEKQSNFTNEKDSLILYECIINNCERCQFSDSKFDFFFGSGDANAKLLIVHYTKCIIENFCNDLTIFYYFIFCI